MSKWLASAATFAALIATHAHAQELQEIVVTAQKRSENIQKVPIAITAVTSDLATSAGVRTSEDLTVVVPGLNIQKQTGAADIFVRGVGTAGGQTGQESAVATFIDGVYQPAMQTASFSLNNIERIEVLKGPQGTLYGRNATGGAINVITRTPSQDARLQAELGYGNKETVEGNLYATGPLTPNMAADIAVYYFNQNQGFGRNVTTGSEINKGKDLAIRSKVFWTPGENTEITLGGFYTKSSGSYGVAIRGAPSASLVTGQQGFPFGFYDIQSEFDPEYYVEQYGGNLKIQQDLGWAQLVSISAIQKVRHHERDDVDLTPLKIIEAPLYSHAETFTQELQIGSSDNDAFKWVAGVFFMDDTAAYDPFHIIGLGLGAGPDPAQSLEFTLDRQKTSSIAAYAQATIKVVDRTNLTLGARYTRDTRKFDTLGSLTIPNVAVIPIDPPAVQKTFKKPTWRIALDHEFSDDVLGYVSYNRGFKSGVYNLSAPGDPVVDPEVLDAYEGGLKTSLMDRRVRLNSAVFLYKYKNLQLQQVNGFSTRLVNAAKATVWGVDVDVDIAAAEGFTIHAGAEYLHARYGDFPGAPFTVPNPNPPFGDLVTAANAKGNRMIRTPDFVATLSADYKFKLAGGSGIGLNVSYAYNDGFFWEPDNRTHQDAYHLVNTQIKWTAPNEKYSVRVWARNLLDEKYFAHVAEQALGDLAAAARGRTFGISLGVNL